MSFATVAKCERLSEWWRKINKQENNKQSVANEKFMSCRMMMMIVYLRQCTCTE
jgi:hypothetical protein